MPHPSTEQPASAPMSSPPGRRGRSLYWLALIPVAHAVLGVLVADRVRPFIAGLPFFMAWVLSGTLLCTVVMAIVYRLDPVNHVDDDKPEAKHSA